MVTTSGPAGADVPKPRLDGRVVLVTGGTRGLGRGLAEQFLHTGAQVAVCARRPPEDPVRADGLEAAAFEADLRDPEAAVRTVQQVLSRFGRLDVCVNNAGGSPAADAATVSPRFVERVVALNLLAPFYVAQAANAVMQQQADGGVIVNVGSLSGRRPSPGTAAYGAAKAGLANLTTSLAMEWAPRVRVHLVTVGYLLTDEAPDHYGDAAGRAAVAATVPMGRLAEPSDVAAACLFLATAPPYLTGADLAVHGGGEPPVFLHVRGAAPPRTGPQPPGGA